MIINGKFFSLLIPMTIYQSGRLILWDTLWIFVDGSSCGMKQAGATSVAE